MLACGSVYLAAAERRLMLAPLIAPGAQKIRLLLLEAVLGISDGVEAVLSSAADALIQAAAFVIAIFSAYLRGSRRAWSFSDMIRTQGDRQ